MFRKDVYGKDEKDAIEETGASSDNRWLWLPYGMDGIEESVRGTVERIGIPAPGLKRRRRCMLHRKK